MRNIIDKFNVYWKQLVPDNNNCGAIAFVQKKVVNRNNIKINFHGEGDINKSLQEYLVENRINNVYLTGRYNKEVEKNLYHTSDLINVLR